jgi:hypothetical protein
MSARDPTQLGSDKCENNESADNTEAGNAMCSKSSELFLASCRGRWRHPITTAAAFLSVFSKKQIVVTMFDLASDLPLPARTASSWLEGSKGTGTTGEAFLSVR